MCSCIAKTSKFMGNQLIFGQKIYQWWLNPLAKFISHYQRALLVKRHCLNVSRKISGQILVLELPDHIAVLVTMVQLLCSCCYEPIARRAMDQVVKTRVRSITVLADSFRSARRLQTFHPRTVTSCRRALTTMPFMSPQVYYHQFKLHAGPNHAVNILYFVQAEIQSSSCLYYFLADASVSSPRMISLWFTETQHFSMNDCLLRWF